MPLSFIATETLVPGAQDRGNERYVQDYVRSKKDVSRYAAGVDKERVSFLETDVKGFFQTLTVEQQAVAQPLYERLARIMSPGDSLHRIVVDRKNFEDAVTCWAESQNSL